MGAGTGAEFGNKRQEIKVQMEGDLDEQWKLYKARKETVDSRVIQFSSHWHVFHILS